MLLTMWLLADIVRIESTISFRYPLASGQAGGFPFNWSSRDLLCPLRLRVGVIPKLHLTVDAAIQAMPDRFPRPSTDDASACLYCSKRLHCSSCRRSALAVGSHRVHLLTLLSIILLLVLYGIGGGKYNPHHPDWDDAPCLRLADHVSRVPHYRWCILAAG